MAYMVLNVAEEPNLPQSIRMNIFYVAVCFNICECYGFKNYAFDRATVRKSEWSIFSIVPIIVYFVS